MLNNKEKTFQCSYDGCDKSYTKQGNLKRHIDTIHKKIKNFQCDKCEYKCFYKSLLIKHNEAVHIQIKNFKCNECEFKFYDKKKLKRHINTVHLKIKNFECDKCEYKCYNLSDLKRHNNSVHLNIQKFQCDKCEYKCNYNTNLKRHINSVHLNINNFKCDKCEYKCSTKKNLKRHIDVIHLNIKNFECDKCNNKFYHKCELINHQNKCTGKEHISFGEYKCREVLEEMNIKYTRETYYKVKHICFLRWDFIIYKNNKVIGFIEMDGQGHFKEVNWSGKLTKEQMKNQLELNKLRDNIKNNFCLDNKYPILRIPYTQYNNTKQLITEFINEQLKYDNI